MASLPTKIHDFRGLASKQNLDSKGWNYHVDRGFPGKVVSTNLSRDNLSREIGRRCFPSGLEFKMDMASGRNMAVGSPKDTQPCPFLDINCHCLSHMI